MDEIISIIDKPTDPRFVDLEGETFNRLKVVGYVGHTKGGSSWRCICECGTIVPKVHSGHLKAGNTKSCGCYRDEKVAGKTTHDMSRTAEYSAYMHARDRCRNPHSRGYKNYGERGIKFRFTSFEQFFNRIGPKPTAKHTLERKDNNGHYEPGNVEWATWKDQADNRRPPQWQK